MRFIQIVNILHGIGNFSEIICGFLEKYYCQTQGKHVHQFYQDCRVTILQSHKLIRCQMKICGQIHLHPITNS
ncbi:hypothetical protein MtrunA17_Chr1g0163171 [Medicago truncatula]|uniref:Uncharacterized protein n=1 Tax=Medicago truncatula TaxID=3880 RepID=A0A396JLH2_MEDTR|nr:hypothetical protein MtrunA17_Chr1g0163171 [Medicago truncatula]